MIDDDKRAKILLEHITYERYLFNLMNSNNESTIDSQLFEFIHDIVDPEEVKEELLDHSDNEVNKERLDKCLFHTWEDAWEFYTSSAVKHVSSRIINVYHLSFISHDIQKVIEKIANRLKISKF